MQSLNYKIFVFFIIFALEKAKKGNYLDIFCKFAPEKDKTGH